MINGRTFEGHMHSVCYDEVWETLGFIEYLPDNR